MGHKLTNKQIGATLKKLLEKQGLTMKQLSERSHIDIATISRIINGKRVASIQHLEALTACLDVSLVEFLDLTNEQSGGETEQLSPTNDALSVMMASFLQNEQIDSQVLSEKRLVKELEMYKLYAETEEGQDVVHQQFERKLRSIDGQGSFMTKLKQLYTAYQSKTMSKEHRIYIGAALLYVIAPIDLIPDMLVPIGYLDDALIIQHVAKHIQRNTNQLL